MTAGLPALDSRQLLRGTIGQKRGVVGQGTRASGILNRSESNLVQCFIANLKLVFPPRAAATPVEEARAAAGEICI